MGFCRLLSMTETFSRNAPSLLPRGISSLSLYLCQKHHITENWREDGREPRAPPVAHAHLQLDSTLIQVSKLERDPKVGRTNSTTNYRKESASRKVRKDRKAEGATSRREGAVHTERAERLALATGSSHGEDTHP